MELFIYDTIGKDFFGEGVTADYVRRELDKAKKGEQITVRINSPGGDVWEGEAIYNMLTRRGNIKVCIDALAASAASFIAMAGDEIEIAENARFMVHEAFTMGYGNKRELTKTVDRLKEIDDQIAAKYAARSGGKRDAATFLANMENETWFTAQEAVDAGLADRIGQKLKVKAAVREPMLTENCIAAYWRNMPGLLAEPEGEEPSDRAKAAIAALDLRLRIEAKHKNAVVVAPIRDSVTSRLKAMR